MITIMSRFYCIGYAMNKDNKFKKGFLEQQISMWIIKITIMKLVPFFIQQKAKQHEYKADGHRKEKTKKNEMWIYNLSLQPLLQAIFF